MLRIGKAEIDITKKEGVTSKPKKSRVLSAEDGTLFVPDILSYIQNQAHTRLTRSTIYEILSRSGRLGDVLVNPQLFTDKVVEAIRMTLTELMVDGVKYEKISEKEYELQLFKGYEFHRDKYTFEISNPNKTINVDLLPLDSKVESQFARDCESREDIEFYFKLPQ